MKEHSLDSVVGEWMQQELKGQSLDKEEFLLAHPGVMPELVQALDELAREHLPEGANAVADDDDREEFASLLEALDQRKQVPPPIPCLAIPNHEILSWIGGGS